MRRTTEVGTGVGTVSQPIVWPEVWRRLRERVKRLIPFASGVAAALLGLYLYNALNPPAQPLTPKQVNAVVAEAMASATPAPAYSEQVYRVIQPSLVLIQTSGTDTAASHRTGWAAAW